MNNQEYLLTCLVEECGEVIEEAFALGKRASKALRFGLDKTQENHIFSNRERLIQELIDLLAVVKALKEVGVIDFSFDEDRIQVKKDIIEKYKQIAIEHGTLSE